MNCMCFKAVDLKIISLFEILISQLHSDTDDSLAYCDFKLVSYFMSINRTMMR
jgi:hypothetical protein